MPLATSSLTKEDIEVSMRAHVRQHDIDIDVLKRQVEMLKDEIKILKKDKTNDTQEDRT